MSAPDPLSSEPKPPNSRVVNTGGGAYIAGSVNTGGGDFVGRDKIVNVLPPQKASLSAAQIAGYEATYLAQVRRTCRYIYTEGIGEPTTELTGVFVMFEAMARPESRIAAPPAEAGDIAPLPERFAQIGHPEPVRSTPQEPSQPPPPPVPLSQALHDHAHLVVLGEPGTGKSTTVQYVALCLATPGWAAQKLKLPEGCIPVLLHLRSCDGVRTLSDFLADAIAQVGMFDAADSVAARRIAVTLLSTWLQEKRLVLLLDALDETAQAQRAAVLEQVARFAASREGRNCRIVVTSRIAGYVAARRPGADFAEYIIRPFASSADALPYVRGWLQVLAPSKLPPGKVELQAKTLVDHMAQQQGLKRILGTPLLLRLAVSVHVETGKLVANRAEIYRRYVDEVLWQRTQAHHGTQFAHGDVQRALAYVAWTLHSDATASSSQLASGIERITGRRISGKEMLAFLQHNLGLLAVYTYDRGPKLAFRHLTFQEYFVGKRLSERWVQDKSATWRLLKPRLHHPAWREPLLLMAGMLPPDAANDLIRCVMWAKSRYERELHRDLLLAMTAAGDCSCADPITINLLTNKALKLARSSIAFYRSGTADWSRGFRRLILPLRWPSGVAANRRVITSLLGQRYASSAPALIQELSDSDTNMRLAAAEALGMIGDRAAVPALRKTLSDSKVDVRMAAAEALGKIGDTAAVPALIKSLADSGSGDQVHRAAAEALGEMGGAAAVPVLIKALSDSSSGDQVRSAATEALGKIGDAAAVPALVGELARLALYSDSDARKTAVEALSKIDAAATLPALFELLASEITVRPAANEALAKILDATCVPDLISLLTNPGVDFYVRLGIADVLGRIGDTAAVPGLLKALASSNTYLRSTAAKSLGKLGDTNAVPALLHVFSDSDFDSRVSSAAAEALGEIGDTAAMPALLRALAATYFEVRLAAAEALGKIGGAAAVHALCKALTDTDYSDEVRMAAANSLGKIGDTAAEPALVKALSHPGSDSQVRRAAAEALGKIGGAAAETTLIKALSNSGSGDQVRRAAAEALGKIGGAAAETTLSRTLSNSGSGDQVRRAAAEALGKIGGAAAKPALVKVLSDSGSDDQVRTAAAEALGEQISRTSKWGLMTFNAVAENLATYVYYPDNRVSTAATEALEQAATAIVIRKTASLGDARLLEW